MASRDKNTPKKEQANFRLEYALLLRMEAVKERHGLHPTLTQQVEAALREWLPKIEADLPPKVKK